MTAQPDTTKSDDTLGALERELEAARRQIDSLTLTLHDVQARLERKHLALLQSRSNGRPVVAPTTGIASMGRARLHLLAVNELQPHCHLDFIVEGLARDQLSPASLRFRLVQHLGHPGIAVLNTNPAHTPLTAWHPSGSEGGVDFMMFMPSDRAGKAQLQSLRTSDWRLLERLAAIAHQQLQVGDWHIGQWWVDVAARLRGELDAVPAMLRFESAVVEGTSKGLELHMTQVEFGRRELGDLYLRWSRSEGLCWLRSSDAAALPLSNWSVDAQGRLTSELALPFGREASILARLRFWQQLAPPERALMRALIDALAQVVRAGSLGQNTGDSGQATSNLRSLVHHMQRQARVLAAYDHLRQPLGT